MNETVSTCKHYLYFLDISISVFQEVTCNCSHDILWANREILGRVLDGLIVVCKGDLVAQLLSLKGEVSSYLPLDSSITCTINIELKG